MQPNILIITLYCGENEYDACKTSVKSQDYAATVDHIFIENLPNIEAHQKCYQTIMGHADEYDLFIKLDADMVFMRDTALNEIIAFWSENNHPDLMSFAVHDFISDQNIMGVHVFSKNCTWNLETHDGLFVDPAPHYPGQRFKTFNDPAPFVSHASDPSDFSAYHFGMHRALKCFQPKRWSVDIQSYGALRTLLSVANHYERTKNDKARLALMGAEAIRTSAITMETGNKENQDITDMNIDFWLSPLRVKIYWILTVLPRSLPSYIWNKIKRKS